MSSTKWLVCALVVVCISIRQSAGAPAPQEEEASPPMPYEYKYDVEDQEKALYFGANEAGDAQGKVIGGYKVLLPDGRLMTVEYTVEGESGFVPKISFEENANPFGKSK
ncbi:cuticle protein 10.9-like [Plodia interpunctella]|uniref:cuticle protein 10.9-like n=1 Tax=Plodia interpunctella TaxID=58824 RepID=UPI0023683A8A|nr:cuticle protein 10.9-like [Plodia interpunctella]